MPRRPWILVFVALVVGVFLVWRQVTGIRARLRGHSFTGGTLHADLDEEGVKLLFDLEHIGPDYYYDPVAYLLLEPDHHQEGEWPEHPSGRLRFGTNNLGFREDEPTLPEKHGLRILVAGDSQVAGPVHNAEAFPHLLQQRLRAHPGRESLEVINAAVPCTGPYCYLGLLRKYLALAPDVFVAVLYIGNDFWDDLRVRCYLDGTPLLWPEGEYLRRVTEATERAFAPMQQGMNQAIRWKTFPDEAERALEMVIQSFTRMQTLCTEHGIQFLVVVLPTKMDVEPEDDAGTQETARRTLGLNDEEAAVNTALGRRFAAAMEAAGIRCLDPLEEMRGAPHPLYWRRDYHMGLGGHALLAELLERELSGRL